MKPHLQTALLQFADTFAEHLSAQERWISILRETPKYKKFLSNLGLQSDASGTGNQIANDSTCGDEEIIFLSDSLWVIIWKSNIMIQVLTGSRV